MSDITSMGLTLLQINERLYWHLWWINYYNGYANTKSKDKTIEWGCEGLPQADRWAFKMLGSRYNIFPQETVRRDSFSKTLKMLKIIVK